MTPEAPEHRGLTARLDMIVDRLKNVEVQVRALVTSRKVEAREFVVQDERGEIRARLDIDAHAPHVIFYDRLGKERLRIGLRPDGSPLIQIGERELPLPES